MGTLALCLMFTGFTMDSRAEAPAAEAETESAPGDTASETDGNGYPVFDFNSRTVKLNSGYILPTDASVSAAGVAAK